MRIKIKFVDKWGGTETRILPKNWRDISARFNNPYSATDSPLNYSEARHEHENEAERDAFLDYYRGTFAIDTEGVIAL